MSQKFIVNQKEFAATLSFMQPICSKKSTTAITSYILFQFAHNELVLKATDLEVSLQYSCDLKENNIESKQFLVHGKKIFEVVKEIEGNITFTIEQNQLCITSGNSLKISLLLKDANEFPPLPERIENLMQIETKTLLSMVTKVAFLIPQNNVTTSLNGLFLEINSSCIKMTTTDGHCLSQISSSEYFLHEPKQWLIPRRAIFEIKKLLESGLSEYTFIGVCNNQLVFSSETFNFFTKLLADQFPQYEMILNKDGFVPAKLHRASFIKTLRRSSCLLSGQFLATKFTFEKNRLKVALKNNDVGDLEEELVLENYNLEPLSMRFYSPYLLNGLQAFDEETIVCFLKNQARPIIFEAVKESESFIYLVMPVSAAHGG
jgi:DNA polymerase-3 subunit beta